jgi:hypothetical protein
MIEDSTPAIESQENPNYPLRRAKLVGASAAAAVAALVIIHGPDMFKNATEGEPVASTTFELSTESGQDNVIGAAETAANELALKSNIDPSAIPYDELVYSSQSASHKANELNGTTISQPGDEFSLTFYKTLFGYRIDIQPTTLDSEGAISSETPSNAIPAPDTH